jgi:hypothetical protein
VEKLSNQKEDLRKRVTNEEEVPQAISWCIRDEISRMKFLKVGRM